MLVLHALEFDSDCRLVKLSLALDSMRNLHGFPDSRIAEAVAILRADSRYTFHEDLVVF